MISGAHGITMAGGDGYLLLAHQPNPLINDPSAFVSSTNILIQGANIDIDTSGDLNLSGDVYINGAGPVTTAANDSAGSGYRWLIAPNS